MHCQRCTARQRITTESRAMITRAKDACGFATCQTRTNRHAIAQCFRQASSHPAECQYVGTQTTCQYGTCPIGFHPTSATSRAGHTVPANAAGNHPPEYGYRLRPAPARPVLPRYSGCLPVPPLHPHHRIRPAQNLRPTGAKPACALGLPVAVTVAIVRPWKAVAHHHDGGYFDTFIMTVQTGNLDRGFVGFRAGIAEKHVIQTRQAHTVFPPRLAGVRSGKGWTCAAIRGLAHK